MTKRIKTALLFVTAPVALIAVFATQPDQTTDQDGNPCSVYKDGSRICFSREGYGVVPAYAVHDGRRIEL